jgi:transposase
MYGWEKLVLLRHLIEEKVPKTEIAERLGVSRRLVYHWIKTGQTEVDVEELAGPRTRVSPPSRLAPFESIIRTRLESYPELSAVRLLAECRAAGYDGGYTQLKLFVATVRPREEPEPIVRFETPPALQAQVDFAECKFPWGKRYALLVVLGYSRLLWLRFYPRQTMLTLMRGIEEAFGYFGGVAHELLFDQLKAVIIDDARPTGGKVYENPEFLRFAAHWDFRIRACKPYRAQTKGKVERAISYVRSNFLYGREFLGDGDLDAQRLTWLDTVANARVHGTTKESPHERFTRDEAALLRPLATHAYQPLVLPLERVRPSQRAVAVPVITVERRSLAAYTSLIAEAR